MSVTEVIYKAAGAPPMQGELVGPCRLCGGIRSGLAFDRWVKETFTDHDKLLPGLIVCHACQFCTAEATPGLAERVRKDKPQKMRNYSHFVTDQVWYPLSKGQKGEMRRLLFAGTEVAVIAESGQKHLLPFARIGWWTFELAVVKPFPRKLKEILTVIEPLYQAGISKTEIETGHYASTRILAVGLQAWQAAESCIKQWRATVPFQLALFLAQRTENE